MTRTVSVVMVGTRGAPAHYGGFETAVEEIGARLADRGHRVRVYCRSENSEITGQPDPRIVAGRMPWLQSVVALPTDYGVLCLTFALYGATTVLVWIYGLITLATVLFLMLALPKLLLDVRALATDAQVVS